MDGLTAADAATARRTVTRKIALRITPFVFLMYLVNYIDRTALGFAGANGMNEDLALTATMFGFASGIFFIGYILLEVPSNLVMQKIGAKVWLSRIAVSWGIVASLTAFVPSFEWLLVARFFLGVAEAGFAPAIFLYLTYWFPSGERAKAFSIFLLGIPISSVITAPLASWLISIGDGMSGVDGWRFMLFVTGVPAIVIGVIAYFYLTNRPQDAKWLTPIERDLVVSDIERDLDPAARQHASALSALRSPKVWALGIAYMGIVYGLYAIGFFAPSMVAGFREQFGTSFSTLQNGFILAVPYAFAAVGMVLWARHSSRTGDVGWHVLGSASLGALGILIAAYLNNPWYIMIGVTLCATGVISSMPVMMSLPARLLAGTSAAAGLALVNTIGNIGGFAGPFFTGWLKDLAGGDARVPFTLVAVILVCSGVIAILTERHSRKISQQLAGGVEDSGQRQAATAGDHA